MKSWRELLTPTVSDWWHLLTNSLKVEKNKGELCYRSCHQNTASGCLIFAKVLSSFFSLHVTVPFCCFFFGEDTAIVRLQ